MDRAIQSISPGQVRVQELADQFLEEKFPLDPQELDTTDPLYKEFLARLKHDPIVCGDSILAGRIAVTDVAVSYIEWLCATKHGELDATQIPIVFDFRRMVFKGSCLGTDTKDYERKVYQGCEARSEVSARAVLTLANGGVVPGSNITLIYYANSRVSYITGGNHRLLACKILGSTTLANIADPELITIYNDQPNEALNHALLYFEELYPAENHTDTRWQTQDIINYESLLLKLAATYKSSTATDERNELYLFTKHDLAERAKLIEKANGPRRRDEPPAPVNSHNVWIPLPKLLQDYEAVHIHLNTPPPKVSRLRQIWRRQPEITPLSPDQKAIKFRWEEWRTTHVQAKI